MQHDLKRNERYGMFEYACHEGNYALQNILSGARAKQGRIYSTRVVKPP